MSTARPQLWLEVLSIILYNHRSDVLVFVTRFNHHCKLVLQQIIVNEAGACFAISQGWDSWGGAARRRAPFSSVIF